MKFEKLLQIYWLKGFLYGGEIIPFETKPSDLLKALPGFGKVSTINLLKKLEYTIFPKEDKLCIDLPETRLQAINVHFSLILGINRSYAEGLRLAVLRLYLIASYRGKCLARGKPSRGQRTWSNARTASRIQSIVRQFIVECKKKDSDLQASIIFNYRRAQQERAALKRKRATKSSKSKKEVVKVKPNLWF